MNPKKPKNTMNNALIHENLRKRNVDEDDDDFSQEISIRAIGDHVWFYSPINPASAVRLNAVLQDLSMKLAPTAFSSMHEVSTPSPIWLHVNSYGGEVFSSFAMADTIERISQIVPVVTIVEGCAASGATFMSTAGARRLMRKNAFMLIHELSGGGWGKFSDLKDNMKSNTTIMAAIKNWYEEKSKLPKKELDVILSRDIWWNAKTCLKYGLVDQII